MYSAELTPVQQRTRRARVYQVAEQFNFGRGWPVWHVETWASCAAPRCQMSKLAVMLKPTIAVLRYT